MTKKQAAEILGSNKDDVICIIERFNGKTYDDVKNILDAVAFLLKSTATVDSSKVQMIFEDYNDE